MVRHRSGWRGHSGLTRHAWGSSSKPVAVSVAEEDQLLAEPVEQPGRQVGVDFEVGRGGESAQRAARLDDLRHVAGVEAEYFRDRLGRGVVDVDQPSVVVAAMPVRPAYSE